MSTGYCPDCGSELGHKSDCIRWPPPTYEQLQSQLTTALAKNAELVEAKIFWATRCTEIEGQLEEVLSGWRRSAMEASLAHGKIAELQDFAIWMTGCGYDFSALPYFCEQREKLLKGK